jgi:hypothetical protein
MVAGREHFGDAGEAASGRRGFPRTDGLWFSNKVRSMNKKNLLQMGAMATMVAVALGLLMAPVVLADNIDPTNKWAWGTNVGWLNFVPAVGGTDTSYVATAYTDHLEGFAWGENIGWIHLGTHTGDGAHTYSNTSRTDYGVNRDVSGNLSGFAWSSSAGWLKFDPVYGGVTIDSATGNFDGYAWGENIGWIHVRGMAGNGATYGVATCVAAAAPTVVTPARVGVNGADLQLSWTDNAANTGGYQVYRSAAPYFSPGNDTFVTGLTAGSTSYLDSGAVGSTSNYTYIVHGVNGCGIASLDSPRVGLFHFTLVPGS